jgi:hypothetical protein
MGKQINFFMLPDDQKLFLSFVLHDPEVDVLATCSSQPTIEVIDRSSCLNGDLPNKGLFCFWNRSFPINPRCISKSTGQQFNLSREIAPVIEYAPSRIVGEGIVRRGRIWATMNYLEHDQWAYKSKAFEAWYDRIARWLHKNFSRTPDSGFFYLGPALLALHKKGKLKYKPFELCRPDLGEIFLEG